MNSVLTKDHLETIVKRYRKRLGYDPSVSIYVDIISESRCPKWAKRGGVDAWVDVDKTHPNISIKIRRRYLEINKDYPRHVVRTIVHELLHPIIGQAFQNLKPTYDYAKHRHAKVEETLVCKIARAIVPVADDDLYNEMSC